MKHIISDQPVSTNAPFHLCIYVYGFGRHIYPSSLQSIRYISSQKIKPMTFAPLIQHSTIQLQKPQCFPTVFVPLTCVVCSWTVLLSSSSTLFLQLWQIHSGTSPNSDWDSEGTASASLRPGTSLSRAWERAGTASASLEPWLGSPFTWPAPQSLNSRWHSKQQVCMDCEKRANELCYKD